MRKHTAVFISFFFCLFISCTPEIKRERIITVTIEPQRYFVERLADSLFQVVTMVPPGTSPETYDPTPVQMASLAKSKAYFKIGEIGFEQVWMDKIEANNPGLLIVNTGKDIDMILSEEEEHSHHEGHGHDHHCHGNVDPHTWCSPLNVKQIVRNCYEALLEMDPENKPVYEQNYISLIKEIEETIHQIDSILKPVDSGSFIIYHPTLTYFARDYNLNQYSIEMDGKEPSPEQLKRLVKTAKEKEVRVIFIQQEFDSKNAGIIAKETGCIPVVINPLSYNWAEEMIRIAKELRKI